MSTDRIVKVILRGDISGLQASMKSAQGLMRNTAEGITSADREAVKFREGLSAVGASATRMGLVATAGVALVTKAAMDWESAWAGVLKTVDGTPAQLTAIEQGLRSMTRELPTTHAELAGIAEAAGQLGVSTDSILVFTRTMADLAETTNLSADEAATSIAQFMNVMQTAPEDVQRLGSTLVELGNNGASTERDIIQMAQNIAGAGAAIGASEADVLSLSNALASVGIEAEAGGSSVSKILIDMSSAVQTNSKDLEVWAATAGMSTEDFARSFSESPIQAFDAFTQGLARINSEGGNVFGLLQDLGQTDVRVTRAMLGMANSGDLLAQSLAMGSAEWQRNEALAKEAAQRYDTTAAQASMAWNSIKDSAIDAGQGMLPVVEAVADAVQVVTGAFSALPGPVKGSVGVIGAFTAAGLLTVGALAKVVGTVSDARVAVQNLGEVAPRSATLLGRVGRAAGIAAAAFATLQVAAQFLNSGERAGVATFTKALLELERGASGARQSVDDLFTVEAPGWGWIGETYEDINGLNDAIDALNPNRWEAFRQGVQGGLFQMETRTEAASKSFRQVDAALTSLVSSGGLDEAASLFSQLRSEMRAQGMTSSEIAAQFPEYVNALDGLSTEQRDAADAAGELAAATETAASRLGMTADEYEAAQKAADGTTDSFRGLGESVADVTVSLSGWLDELEKQNQALAEFTENSIQAASRGLDDGLIKSLQEAGPEGALRLKQLADASESEIGRANAAWRDGEAAASRYSDAVVNIPDAAITEFSTPGAADAIDTAVAVAEKYNLTPDQVATIMEALDFASEDIEAVQGRLNVVDGRVVTATVRANTEAARAALQSLKNTLDAINPFKTVTINTVRTGDDAGNAARAPRRATGGPVPEGYAVGGRPFQGRVPGTPPLDPTADNVLAVTMRGNPLLVRSREWIVNEKASDANDAWIRAINDGLVMDDYIRERFGEVPGFASGGRLERLEAQRRVRDLQRDLRKKERYGKEPKAGEPDRRPRRYVLRGLDRKIAQEELKEARAELADLRRPASQRREAREQRRQEIAQGAADFATTFDIDQFTTPAAVERQLTRKIAESAEFFNLLIELKRRGTAPWLLEQLRAQGPSKGTIRFARSLLSDSAALARLNAQANVLNKLSGAAGAVFTDPRFSADKAWGGSLTAAQSRVLNQTLKIEVATNDPYRQAREVRRIAEDELAGMAARAGV